MKTIKISYWASTAIVALMMIYSAYAYLTEPMMDQAFQHLGFPAYFRVELAVAKIIGALLLLAPVASRFKEWAYAGFGITFVSALVAHTMSGDPVSARIMPVVFLLLLAASYYSYKKLHIPAQA
ncbi:MAG TPA: DoxX family protein [Pedobacter sp.]|uniref:DoxX family protein n=1 Tax=Pedobacter sp. TaxID=1411316 RepID=UPI002C9DEFCA|nr:DoxX family protein [Pedobacter sp.]HMI04147.1 DoxX family protein [Pedobacter sp.]